MVGTSKRVLEETLDLNVAGLEDMGTSTRYGVAPVICLRPRMNPLTGILTRHQSSRSNFGWREGRPVAAHRTFVWVSKYGAMIGVDPQLAHCA